MNTDSVTTTPTAEVPDLQTALATVEDRTLPFAQRLSVAANALRGLDPTQQLAALQERCDSLTVELRAAQASAETLSAQVDDLTHQLAAREADLEAADSARAAAELRAQTAEAAEQDLDTRANALAAERMRERGVPAASLPSATDRVPEAKPEDVIKNLAGHQRIAAALHFRDHGTLPDGLAPN